MKLGFLLAALLVVALAIIAGLPISGTRSFSVVVPGSSADTQRSSELARFAQSHDWKAELEAAGLRLPKSHLEAITEDLAPGRFELHPRRLDCRVEYTVFAPVWAGSASHIEDAFELIHERLQLEARLIAYPDLSPAGRKSVLWQAYGTGFDDRLSEFLDAQLPQESDPELRAAMEAIRPRLTGAGRGAVSEKK